MGLIFVSLLGTFDACKCKMKFIFQFCYLMNGNAGSLDPDHAQALSKIKYLMLFFIRVCFVCLFMYVYERIIYDYNHFDKKMSERMLM